MAQSDIVTIGGSAGSIESLAQIVKALPPDLPAAVFIIVRRRSLENSWLAYLLNRPGALRACEAEDNERISSGRIYVAPPDRHLVIAEGHIHLTRGPKEGLHRPSINATFRSAAAAYGNRVIGVLLSGMLDNGASGLWEIVHRGGVSIVQQPEEARFPSMPLEALTDAPIHYRLRTEEIAPRLVELTNESEVPHAQSSEFVNDIPPERFSGFTWPECLGPLYEHRKNPTEFRCRTGACLSAHDACGGISQYTGAEDVRSDRKPRRRSGFSRLRSDRCHARRTGKVPRGRTGTSENTHLPSAKLWKNGRITKSEILPKEKPEASEAMRLAEQNSKNGAG